MDKGKNEWSCSTFGATIQLQLISIFISLFHGAIILYSELTVLLHFCKTMLYWETVDITHAVCVLYDHSMITKYRKWLSFWHQTRISSILLPLYICKRRICELTQHVSKLYTDVANMTYWICKAFRCLGLLVKLIL